MMAIDLLFSARLRDSRAWRSATALAECGRRAWRRRELRRYIAEMDDRVLSDVGVSRAQALFLMDWGGRSN